MPARLRSLLVAAAAVIPAIAQAQISVLSNIVEEKEAAKGETYTGRIIISNPTTTPQAVRLYKNDYNFKADGTTDYGDPGSTPRSNATWVALQTERVTVPPRSEITVPYTIKVPTSDSLRGSFWSAIMVEGAESNPTAPTGRSGQMGIGSIIRYAVQVATHIGSTGTRTVKFEKPTAGKTATGEATLDLDVITSGERAVRPKLSVELYDATGKLAGKLNQDRGLVYPGSSFRQHFDFGKIAPGTYKAIVFADTGDEKVLAQQYTVVF